MGSNYIEEFGTLSDTAIKMWAAEAEIVGLSKVPSLGYFVEACLGGYPNTPSDEYGPEDFDPPLGLLHEDIVWCEMCLDGDHQVLGFRNDFDSLGDSYIAYTSDNNDVWYFYENFSSWSAMVSGCNDYIIASLQARTDEITAKTARLNRHYDEAKYYIYTISAAVFGIMAFLGMLPILRTILDSSLLITVLSLTIATVVCIGSLFIYAHFDEDINSWDDWVKLSSSVHIWTK